MNDSETYISNFWCKIDKDQYVLKENENDTYVLAKFNDSKTISFYTYHSLISYAEFCFTSKHIEIKSNEIDFKKALKRFEDRFVLSISNVFNEYKQHIPFGVELDWIEEFDSLKDAPFIKEEIHRLNFRVKKELKEKENKLREYNKSLLAKIRNNKLNDKHAYKWLKKILDKLVIEDLKIKVYKM